MIQGMLMGRPQQGNGQGVGLRLRYLPTSSQPPVVEDCSRRLRDPALPACPVRGPSVSLGERTLGVVGSYLGDTYMCTGTVMLKGCRQGSTYVTSLIAVLTSTL